MKIIEICQKDDVLITDLLEIWENAVSQTHLFLSPNEIENIKKYVPQALQNIKHLLVAFDSEPVGFIGINGQKIEMLFVSKRKAGIGKALIQKALAKYSVNEVVVNEQNPQARGFYEHLGFKVFKKSKKDEQGKPYPILYMKRENS